jgi:gamma-glutamyltranspeptidase/glutathione hydrolase
MFRQGGNIVDAAVAVSFAISVERPQSTGIGGGGFLMFYEKKRDRVHVWDFRERAPARAHAKMFLKEDGTPDPLRSIDGPLAVAVPGLVRGLWDIHRRHGKLPWATVVAPAVKLAQEGFPVYPHLVDAIKDRAAVLKLDPEAARTFFTPEGEVPPVGYRLLQPELAHTLRTIAEKGPDGFYKGKVARLMVESIQARGGKMSLADLANYQTRERRPVEGSYRGYKIYSMPPPSSGGTHVVQILNLLEPQNLRQWGPQHAETVHRFATAGQIAFADRARYMGDPDFSGVPVKKLTSKAYAKHMQAFFGERALSSGTFPLKRLPDGPTETTHFTLADGEDNVVVSTQTINGWFGAGMMGQGTGVVLNNEMDDFAQKVGAQNLFGAVGGDKNLVAPGKRPLSSMSPTIIFKDGRPVLALGTPSGTRIITCVAQTALNVMEFGMPLYDAVAATRFHHQWQPEELRVEDPSLPEETLVALRGKGHNVVAKALGCQIQAVQRTAKGWLGVSDPRGEGLAIGE